MLDFALLLETFARLLTDPIILIGVFIGTVMGIIFGSLPGLTATMGVALLIPLTYTMSADAALGMMLGCYMGGMAGGAISAILLNIPGTPSAVCTSIDGYPMTQQNKSAQALGWAAYASGFGTFFSWALLVLIAPLLASFTLSFGSQEYFSLAVFGLTIIAAVSGKSILKGIIAGLFGVFLSTIGIDPVLGFPRFTFGTTQLLGGIKTIPALIGFFSIPQILAACTQNPHRIKTKLRTKDFVPSFSDILQRRVNIIRSSLIGALVGMIPATGGNVAAFVSYDQAKRFSKDSSSFGKGNPDGVIAAEAANNGVVGGALVPLLTLGIPGDSITAVLLGGLMVHGITPGPTIFEKHLDVVYGMFFTLLLATIFMVLVQTVGIKVFVKVLNVPPSYLAPILVVLSMVGSFALRNNYFDVVIALVLGLYGYLMTRAEFPMAPVVLGLVLGPMFESEFRRSLSVTQGDLLTFFKRPISLSILSIAMIILVYNVYAMFRHRSYDGDHSEQLD